MKKNTLSALSSATDPRRNSVIRAAAGSGKTWLLTSRLIRLLLGGANPGSILAITFTRKAAAEMHLRLRDRLYALCLAPEDEKKRLLQETGVDPTPEALFRAGRLYEELLAAPHELRATTFHAFCQELLTRFPLEAGVAPGFSLSEHTGELEQAAFRELDRDLAEPGTALDLAMNVLLEECSGLSNARRALHEFLTHRSDWWAYTEDKADPLGYAAHELRRQLDLADDSDPREAFAADLELRQRLATYVACFNGEAAGKHDAVLARLRQALSPETSATDFYRLLRQAFLKKDGEPREFVPLKALAKTLGAAPVQQLLELHAGLLERLQTGIERYLRYKTFRRTHAWHRTGQCLLEHYQRLKREQDLLDFADLEWFSYRLINHGRHAEWVQYKLDQRIDHLLVDEFQDTNPTQWRLLVPLLEEMAAGGGERSRSVFLVGDEKQSIYRFRRADPALLGFARDWLEQHAGADTHEQHVSWRSSPAVIEFVNSVFTAPATDTATAVTHSADYDLADFRRHETHQQQLWGHAELLPLIAPDPVASAMAPSFRNPLQTPRIVEEDQRHRREADVIATKILSLRGQAIDDHGRIRALGYGDALILLRDRRYAAFYEAALRDAGIPYAGAGRGTFLDCLEVRDIVQLLTLLVTPFDDLALAAVLRSPIFAATDADLMVLAERDRHLTWYDRLQALAGDAGGDAPLARAVRLLVEWRRSADRIPVHDLLDRIYYDANVPERYQSASAPHLKARVAANLVRLLELALEVDAGRFPSLSRFIARLDMLTQEENESLGSASGGQVRLLTIHAAKGLESPVVFVADSARLGLAGRERGVRALIEWPMRADRPTQFLLAGRRADADRVTCDALIHDANAARREQANLLYVALTRAQQMLYVSGCESDVRGHGVRRAGDAARGWYGFIERRLQAAGARLTLRLTRLPHPEGEGFYNVCGAMSHSVPAPLPALVAAMTTTVAAPVDPALTRPFRAAGAARASTVQPSHAMTDPDVSEPADRYGQTALMEAKQRGIVIHRMLERLSSTSGPRASTRELLWREFGHYVSTDRFDDCWRESGAVFDAPEHRELFDPSRYDEARNEVAILYRWNDTEVVGVIDRLLIRDSNLVLIDYKTDHGTSTELETLAATYAPQLKLYAEGLRRLWPGKNVEALLLFTTSRRCLRVNV